MDTMRFGHELFISCVKILNIRYRICVQILNIQVPDSNVKNSTKLIMSKFECMVSLNSLCSKKLTLAVKKTLVYKSIWAPTRFIFVMFKAFQCSVNDFEKLW
jgi:hypothetical protein